MNTRQRQILERLKNGQELRIIQKMSGEIFMFKNGDRVTYVELRDLLDARLIQKVASRNAYEISVFGLDALAFER